MIHPRPAPSMSAPWRKSAVWISCLLILGPQPSASKTAPPLPKIAVLELRNPAGLQVQEVAYMTDLVRGAVVDRLRPGFRVMTRENLLQTLPPGTDLAGCVGDCELETGRNVGADYVISGELVSFGGELRLTLKLHDTHTGAMLVTARGKGATVLALEKPGLAAAGRLALALVPATDDPKDQNRSAPRPLTDLERIERDRARHETEVDQVWTTTARIAARGGPDGRKAIELFLARYASHPLGNPRRSDAETLLYRLSPVQWIRLTATRFSMGTDGVEPEGPVRSMRMSRFDIGQSEITVAQYRYCVEAGVCSVPGRGEGCNWAQSDRDDHPINCVTWNQASTYVRWIGARLPSEAEWELAATSGGEDWRFPWGNGQPTCAHAILAESTTGCGRKGTWPVCAKPAGRSRQGVCDLAGNVSEWVEDWYHDRLDGLPSDGRPRSQATGPHRTVRGGHFEEGAWEQRSTRRFGHHPTGHASIHIGFRAARDARE